MSLKRTDPIFGPPRGSNAEVLTYLNGADAKDSVYIGASYGYATEAGIDPAVVWTQWLHETGDAGSRRWNDDLNPAGIGIPADNTPQPFRIPDAQFAALLHVTCLYVLVKRQMPPVWVLPMLWPDAEKWVREVWLTKATAPEAPPVRTVDDLDIRYKGSDGDGHATWAWGHVEGDYAPKMEAKARAVFTRGLPDVGDGGGADVADGYTRNELYILVDAGHRSTDRSGNAAEMDRTDEMAEAYVLALRTRGFASDLVRWWQRDQDGDGDPRWTVGNLNTVALGCAADIRSLLARRPTVKLAVFLSCHFNGPSSPWHVIVPDNRGLTTAYAGGAPADDTAAKNTLDVTLAKRIALRQSEALNDYPLLSSSIAPGVMSEASSGVGLQGYRLALFAGTADLRARCIRLIIEHGGTAAPVAQREDFNRVCAKVAALTLEEVLVQTATPPKPSKGKKVKPPKPYLFRTVNGRTLVPYGGPNGSPVRFAVGTTGREAPDPNALPTGEIKRGTRATVAYVEAGADGDVWLWLASGSRVKAKACVGAEPVSTRAAEAFRLAVDDEEDGLDNLDTSGPVDAAGRPIHGFSAASADECGLSVPMTGNQA